MTLGFGARGGLVETLQRGLGVSVDGIFGNATDRAMRDWQQKNGLAATGECHGADWVAITGKQVPTLFERCLWVTSAIEGHGWAKAKILADGAGITAGIIGFTTAAGSLQRVFQTAGFPLDALALANGQFVTADQPGRINALLNSETGRAAQLEVARRRYWMDAAEMAQRFGFGGYPWLQALCFDIAVQNGKAASSPIHGLDPWQQARALVEAHVARAKPQYKQNVRARKQMFLHGAGEVHGIHFRLPMWGLDQREPSSETGPGRAGHSGAA